MYIILAKPERNVRSAFTTSTVVRMHVGDGKSSSAASRSSSLVNLWKRRGSTGETLRYFCVCGLRVPKRLVDQVNAGLLCSYIPRHHFSISPLWDYLWCVHARVCASVCLSSLRDWFSELHRVCLTVLLTLTWTADNCLMEIQHRKRLEWTEEGLRKILKREL